MWRRKRGCEGLQTCEKMQLSVEGSLTSASLEVKSILIAFLPAEYGAAAVENAVL